MKKQRMASPICLCIMMFHSLIFPCALLGWILILTVVIEVKLCCHMSLQVTCAICFIKRNLASNSLVYAFSILQGIS
jgi:hypothetical protein